jgi:hypothetical protein
MRKVFTLLFMLAGSGSLMAQIKFVKPQDGAPYPKFDYQKDTTWRTLPKLKDTLKSNNYSLGHLNNSSNLMAATNTPLISATTDGYNMPIAVLEGRSNMPVKKIEGFYTMPVVGSNMPKPQKLKKVNP